MRKHHEQGIGSTLTKTLVASAFALSPAIGLAAQESGGQQQHRRHQGELTFTQIDVPDATFTTANGITKHGQIVGTFIDAGDVARGYLLDDGHFTTIDIPGATTTEAVGINERDEIVGVFIDAGGVAHGFCAVVNKGFGRSIKNPSQAQRLCNGDAQAE